MANQRMKTSKTNRSYQGSYVDGNTVRKLDTIPQNRPLPKKSHTSDKKRKISENKAARRKQEKALHMDLPYVILLTIATICTLYLCVNYLHIHSSITSRMYNIEKLEKQLELQKNQNNALESSINTYVDLDHVYQVATQELGMVYANKEQVIMYDKTESEYIRQYEDIPKYQER